MAIPKPGKNPERSEHRREVLEGAEAWLAEIDKALEEPVDEDNKAGPRENAEPKETPGETVPTTHPRSAAMPKKVRDEVARKDRRIETK